MIFPLRHPPSESYHEPPRSFGAYRDGGARKHAGCDLYAAPDDDVLAMEAGTVTRSCYPFYDGVSALEITGASGRVIRYGEIAAAVPGIRLGSKIAEGQVIARVGKMARVHQAMLHLEMYAGTGSGPLTDRAAKGFKRRADLMDPTPLLDGAAMAGGETA
jgi:murein DD-endopeptidase MepM/ murein hydrolase activator NlpD